MSGSFCFHCFEYVVTLSLFFWKIVWLSMKFWFMSYFLSSQWRYFSIFWHLIAVKLLWVYKYFFIDGQSLLSSRFLDLFVFHIMQFYDVLSEVRISFYYAYNSLDSRSEDWFSSVLNNLCHFLFENVHFLICCVFWLRICRFLLFNSCLIFQYLSVIFFISLSVLHSE